MPESNDKPLIPITAASVPNGRAETLSCEIFHRCPVCHAAIPPEHIGRKTWCRRCGYLES